MGPEGPAHIFIPQPYALAGRKNAARLFFLTKRLFQLTPVLAAPVVMNRYSLLHQP